MARTLVGQGRQEDGGGYQTKPRDRAQREVLRLRRLDFLLVLYMADDPIV